MGRRALDFSRAHPDSSPGYTASVTRLEERLARAEQLATQQREGILDVRGATVRKRDLRRTLKRAHLAHLAQVAKVAAREEPELAQKFVLRPGTAPYLAFRTAARAMAAEAESRKELLVKHGLAETVLESLTQMLQLFDAAIERGAEARRQHVGASAELDTVADEIVQIVNSMDGLNRFRFEAQGELMAAWESVSNVIAGRPGPGKPAEEPPPSAGGEVRPAA